jgi:hypothetical protein
MTATTTIRLTPADKRRIAAAAKRQGVSTHKFIVDAVLARTVVAPDDDKLTRLAAMVEEVREAVESELDYRITDSAWQRHLKLKSRLYTPEEARRELGL